MTLWLATPHASVGRPTPHGPTSVPLPPQRLSTHSETELNEEFLRAWWPTNLLGKPPSGTDAIARMRLAVHMQ